MDSQEALSPGRFLELLNNPSRTAEEEQELQAELIRQATEQQKTAEATVAEGVTETVTVEQPAQEVPEAPTPDPTPEQSVEQVAPNATNYTVEQLAKETQDAISFLKTQDRSVYIEMAEASFAQAAYWLQLAQEGK